MSIKISASSLSQSQGKSIALSLTFTYAKKNIMRNKYSQETEKSIACYISQEDYVYLPFYWANKNLNMSNEYTTKQYEYKRIMDFRDNKQMIEFESIIDNLNKYKSVALTIRTGAGKTCLSLFTACYFREFTVVLLHNDSHCDQWYNSVLKYTDAKAEIVTKNMNGVKNDTQILICLYTRWEKVPEIIRKDVGLLIIDECDQYCNKSGIESILAFEPKKIMGCTATFSRPGTGLEIIMNSVLGYNFVTREFDVDFTVARINTGIKGVREKSKYAKGADWNTLKHSLLYNDKRNEIIIELILIRLEEEYKIMVLSKEVKHVMIIYELLQKANISSDFFCGKKKCYVDSKVLVATAQKAGRGFDEESSCKSWNKKRINCVMIVDYVNNETDIIQWIGRSFRASNPRVDILIDKDPSIENQWRNNKKIFVNLGANIETLDIDLDETVII
jgi:hypothetical protein